jgi:DNA-binding response OmpR family regulator
MARVTVINDSDDFLALMREILLEAGHRMTGFKAVEASIEDVVDTRPQLLIVDLRLQEKAQEISGWELIILARSHRELGNVPIILCTADVWELQKRAADLEQIAGVHVRPKPFNVEEMIGLVRRLLAEANGDRQNRPIATARPDPSSEPFGTEGPLGVG